MLGTVLLELLLSWLWEGSWQSHDPKPYTKHVKNIAPKILAGSSTDHVEAVSPRLTYSVLKHRAKIYTGSSVLVPVDHWNQFQFSCILVPPDLCLSIQTPTAFLDMSFRKYPYWYVPIRSLFCPCSPFGYVILIYKPCMLH